MRTTIITFVLLALTTTLFAKPHSGNYTMTFNLSEHKTGEEVKLWVPYPISDENQKITNISWEGNFSEAAVYTDQANGTPMLFARWPKEASQRKLVLVFDAERSEQLRRNLTTETREPDPTDFTLYLAATSLGPIDGGVKELANQITAGRKGVLAKARAVYDWTVDNTFRDPGTRGCGVGDVNKLLKRPGGKCADISSIYVAIARAAGIPSREVFGIRSGHEKVQDVTAWQHCWAEFYLPGTGWVPVDPADVRKAMLKQNLKLNDPEVENLREYYWGGVDPYRVRLSEGRDLELIPRHSGPPLNYLMYPFAQIGQKTIDWLDPEGFKYEFTWRPL